MGKSLPETMVSWSWRSIKLLLLHLVGVPYYFTYNDDARSHTNQVNKYVIYISYRAPACEFYLVYLGAKFFMFAFF
jgi:hypothetical protein